MFTGNLLKILAAYADIVLAGENILTCPASRGYSLVWLLAFTEPFASLISHTVGLFTLWEKPLRKILTAMQERNLCS